MMGGRVPSGRCCTELRGQENAEESVSAADAGKGMQKESRS